MLCCSPEKILPPDLAGMVKKEQHERWAGMLVESRGSPPLALRGLRAVERQPLLWESRTSLRTLKPQSEVMSGLLSYSMRKRTASFSHWFYHSFMDLGGHVLPYILHWDEIKVG
ncbi:hypothetical protein AMECASPLE_020349 [Ameca splendens]|uniref:Uncharacterized protein n=1 Tax=Ameca splendens TaxID=208324 RepID=A0ABV0YRH5_9TELE